MSFTQSLRCAFRSRSRASRRDKSRPSSRHRLLSQVEFLEDRLAPAILMVTNLLDVDSLEGYLDSPRNFAQARH